MPALTIDERAQFAFGTARVFELRARRARARIQVLTFLGIVSPLLVGGVVGAFGAASPLMAPLLGVTGVIGLFQLIMSAWSLVAKWDDQFAYAQESHVHNDRLSQRFAGSPTDGSLALLVQEDDERRAQDSKQGITPQEARYAMRLTLFQNGRACVSCQEVAKSKSPSGCSTCGDFPVRWIR